MEKQDQTFNRLLKKLSALRATLKGEELIMLDELITGTVDEVGAHAMHVTPISPARASGRASSPDEARANAMHVTTGKATGRASGRASSPDEARANAMHVTTGKATGRASGRASSPDEARA